MPTWRRRTAHCMPTPHIGVLIATIGAGFVFDVACYIGRDTDGKDRWILSDVTLDSAQITHWTYIDPPTTRHMTAKDIGL